jgi:uncharacterized RDD family membrane protein YckC
LGALGRSSPSRRLYTPTEGNLAIEPEWRREVSTKLQDYRTRRGGSVADLQTALPFEPPSPLAADTSAAAEETPSPVPSKRSAGSRKYRNERFEISIAHLDVSAAPASYARWQADSAPGANVFHAPLYSMASLSERRKAAIADTGLLLFSYGGMLALFTVLGGHIGFNKLDLAVAGATFALFYAQYFALFTIFGGSTPGMMLQGLRVVSFDGGMPTSRQMVWRSFGYLISAGACFLGFVWALWDDDQLCWQDRISQTYLTPIE